MILLIIYSLSQVSQDYSRSHETVCYHIVFILAWNDFWGTVNLFFRAFLLLLFVGHFLCHTYLPLFPIFCAYQYSFHKFSSSFLSARYCVTYALLLAFCRYTVYYEMQMDALLFDRFSSFSSCTYLFIEYSICYSKICVSWNCCCQWNKLKKEASEAYFPIHDGYWKVP